MHFDRPDGSFEFIVSYSSTTVHVKGSVSVVRHKMIELNKIFMDAILEAIFTVMNENRRNKVFTVTKQCESTQSRHLLLIKLLYSCEFHFNVSSESNILQSERC